MKKKGMSDVFRYILVLVAGVIVLLFFVRFAFQQVFLIESVNAVDIRETLNDYFNALSTVDEDMFTTAKINSKVNINYPSCGDIGVKLKEGKSDSVRYSHIIFSPNMLDKEINVWAKKWSYPFDVDAFFYLLDRDTKIFLVGNSRLVNELIGVRRADGSCCAGSEYIDSRFNAEKRAAVDANFIEEQAREYDNVIFVFFDQEMINANLGNVKERKINAADCEDEKDDEKCRGSINFGDKQAFFAGKAMLYGAIFAGDSKNYECGFDMAVKKLKLVSEIYDKKRLLLARLKPDCGKYAFSVNIDASNSNLMYNSMNGLIENNKVLVGGNCAKLF